MLLEYSIIEYYQMQVETFFLMPEIPSVKYVLKCSGDQYLFAGFLKKISKIPELISIYKIPKKKLKSKENLIFE
jgi:hypothetical protein